MCEEESEDTDAVAKLFQINDSIHRTIERYKLFKKGDIEGANKIPQGTLGTSGAGVTKGANNTLNLIDFGDPEPVSANEAAAPGQPSQPAPKGNALEDDLLGLSLGGNTFGQTGGISLGASNGSSKSVPNTLRIAPKAMAVLGLSGMSVPQNQTRPAPSQQSNLDLFGGLANSGPPSQISSPPPPAISQAPRAQAARSTPDPFAALNSPAPRQASPFQFQQSVKPQQAGSADLLGVGSPAPSSSLAQSTSTATNDDDEWTFASAVPDSSKEITVVNSSVSVIFTVRRDSDSVLLISSRISNNTTAPIGDLTFQSAVSKVCSTLTCYFLAFAVGGHGARVQHVNTR
jgi:hypothetical protein